MSFLQDLIGLGETLRHQGLQGWVTNLPEFRAIPATNRFQGSYPRPSHVRPENQSQTSPRLGTRLKQLHLGFGPMLLMASILILIVGGQAPTIVQFR